MKPPRAIAKAWTQGVVEILMFFPFYLLISYFIQPIDQLPMWAAHLTLYYTVGFAVHRLLPPKRYLIYPLTLILVVGIVYLFNGISIAAILSLFIGGFLCFRGMKAFHNPWHEVFQTKYYWIGLIFYFIASGIFSFIDAMEPYLDWIFWLGAMSLVVTLLISNQKNLKKETLSGKHTDPKVSSPIVWQNRIFIGLSLLLILLIGMLGKVREGFEWLQRQMEFIINRVMDLKNSLVGSGERDMPGEVSNPELIEGAGANVDPSSVALSLQTILFYVVFALLGIAALVLLYFAGKYAIRGIKKLIAWLNGNIHDSGTHQRNEDAYEDQKESLFNLSQLRKQAANRMKDWLSSMLEKEPKWNDLHSNIERIRYLYRQTLLRYIDKGYHFKSSNTPLETTKEIAVWDEKKLYPLQTIVDYYNQARYDDNELKEAGQKLEEIKNQSGL